MTHKQHLNKRVVKCVFFAFAGVLALLFVWGIFIEPETIEVTTHYMAAPNYTGKRPARIVHITDIHFEGGRKREKALPNIVKRLEPDVIVLTGDYLNNPEK